MHPIRKQDGPELPSGTTPRLLLGQPELYGAEQSWMIKVPKTAVDELRKTIPVSREDAFRWVDDEFAHQADAIWSALGQPAIDLGSVWQVFLLMVAELQTV